MGEENCCHDKAEVLLMCCPECGRNWVPQGDQLTDLERFTQHVDRLFVKPKNDSVGLLLHAAVGIAGEAGEILDTVKRTWIYSQDLNRDNLLEEAGDVLFYTAALLVHSGYTLKMAMEHNMAKLAKRYPNGYTDEAATNRLDKIDCKD